MNLALAVGKERMGQDAFDLVQLLGSIQGKEDLICPFVTNDYLRSY